MEFIDLKRQYQRIQDGLMPRFENILSNARFIMGREVNEIEERLASYVGVKHCISCSSGTDALLMPLMIWGIGEGDAVFVPTFTFYASAEVIALSGATPIFVDVDYDTFNMDVEKLKEAIKNVKKEGKLRLRAIIAVDLFGQPACNVEIEKIAKNEKLLMLEDAAQGFGGSINKKKAGGFGDIAATSFFPAKPLGCYGDGGAIFTNNDDYAEQLKSVRIHGQGDDKYDNIRLGINGRLDTMQAAVLLEKINIFGEELKRRNEVATAYCENLKGYLDLPILKEGNTSSWAQFTCKAKDKEERKAIIKALKNAGIPTAIYYPIPLHKQTAFRDVKSNYCNLSTSEKLADKVFSLPMHPYLEQKDIETVSDIIKGVK